MDGESRIKTKYVEPQQAMLNKGGLGSEEFHQLFQKYVAGDISARDKIVYSFARFAFSIAKQHTNRGEKLNDLFQCGLIGVMDALERFKPSFGNTFSTYARWWIRHYIERGIDDQPGLLAYRVPIHRGEAFRVIGIAIMHFAQVRGRLPEDEELVEALFDDHWLASKCNGDERARKRRIRKQIQSYRYHYHYVASLDAPLGANESGELPSLYAFIPSESPNAETQLLQEADDQIVIPRIRQILMDGVQTLSGRGPLVISARFGLDGRSSKSLQEVGNLLGVCRERIRQLEVKAIRQLFQRVRAFTSLRDEDALRDALSALGELCAEEAEPPAEQTVLPSY